MVAPAARPDAMRRHNLALILAQVHRDGALTRAELTARLGLSRSTMMPRVMMPVCCSTNEPWRPCRLPSTRSMAT